MPTNIASELGRLTADQLNTVTYESGLTSDLHLTSASFVQWSDNQTNNTTGLLYPLDTVQTALQTGGTITYSFFNSSEFTAGQINNAVQALAIWEGMAGITFEYVADPAQATINFVKDGDTFDGTLYQTGTTAFSDLTDVPTGTEGLNRITSGVIQLDTTGAFGDFNSYSVRAGYGIDTLVHEVGHLVGLGHTGPYNAGVNNPAPNQNNPTDVRTWSIMSYIDPNAEAPPNADPTTLDPMGIYASSYTPVGLEWGRDAQGFVYAPLTPMGLDIIAAQRLLGAPDSTMFSGFKTFGFHSNVTYTAIDGGHPLLSAYDFNTDQTPIVTIYDWGQHNTLDVSGFTQAASIDLNDGEWSSVAGLTDNIFIEWGTQIDTALGGIGNDIFNANSRSDTFIGGGGFDTAELPFDRSAYDFQIIGGEVQITDTRDGHGEVDTLRNISTVVFANTETFATAQLGAITWTGNGGDNTFNNVDNWDLGVIPNAHYDLTIPAGFTVDVTLEATNTVDSFQLAAGSEMDIDIGHFIVNDAGAASSNFGEIVVGDADGTDVTLYIEGTFDNAARIQLLGPGAKLQTHGGTTTLGGFGTISMLLADIGGSSADTLDTLINVGNTIHGSGNIGGGVGFQFLLAFENDATVNADDVADLTIHGAVTNHGELLGSGIAALVLDGNINNAPATTNDPLGVIVADGVGHVQFDTVTVAGGAILSSNGGSLDVVGDATLDGSTSAVSLSGDLVVDSGATLTLTGIISGGTIDASAGRLNLAGATMQGVKTLGSMHFVGNGNIIAFAPFTFNQLTLDTPLIIAAGQAITYSDPTNSHGIVNHSTIALAGTHDDAHNLDVGAGLLVDGELQLLGGGTVALSNQADSITGVDNGPYYDVFYNANNAIIGAGTIAHLQEIYNDANNGVGTIEASGGSLLLSAPQLWNGGWMGAAAGGDLVLVGTLDNNYVSPGTLGGAGLITLGGTLDGAATAGGLEHATLAAGGTVDAAGPGGSFFDVENDGTMLIRAGATLHLLAGTMDNAGSILLQGLNDGHNDHVAVLSAAADITLAGTGTVVLQGNDVLTGATLENVGNTIQGSGRIGDSGFVFANSFANNTVGTVDANAAGATLVLDGIHNALTNAGLIEASDGGTLEINGLLENFGTEDFGLGFIQVNGVGTLSATGPGSVVLLNGGTVDEGLLESADGGVILAKGSSALLMDGPVFVQPGDVPPYAKSYALTNYADLRVAAGATLGLAADNILTSGTPISATLNNYATIALHGSAGLGATLAVQTQTLSVEGGGTITLNSVADTITGTGNTLENAATIEGFGQLGAGELALTNDGAIIATTAGQALVVQAAGTFSASGTLGTDGGTLTLLGTIVDNGVIKNLGGGGVVQLGGTGAGGTAHAATLQGGQILAGAVVESTAAGSTLDGSYYQLDNFGTVLVAQDQSLSVTGYISNAGTFELQGTHATLALSGDTTFQVNGQIQLDDATDAIDGAGGQWLVSDGDTITGAGHIGNGHLVFDNDSATSRVTATGSMEIDTGFSAIINNGTLEAADGGRLDVKSGVTNSGVITAGLTSSVVVEGDVTGSGTLSVFGGALTLDGAVAAEQHVAFSGFFDETLALGAAYAMDGTIDNFGFLQTIDLRSLGADSVHYDSGVLHVMEGATEVAVLNLGGAHATNFDLRDDGNSGTEIFAEIPCFAAGTRLLTARGEIAVEDLREGDLLCSSLRGGLLAVKWLGHRRVDIRRHPRPDDVRPIRIAPGAFAPGMPIRPLRLSPDHAVFIDGVLIPVRYLVNGTSIAREDADAVTYWHVELTAHDVILAEGLPCETYLDTGNRSAFANGGAAVMMQPDFALQSWALRIWETQACARLVMDGAELEAARSVLLERAEMLGHATTTDAGVHLMAGGTRLLPKTDGRVLRFHLPTATRHVRLVSRSVVPAEIYADGTDHRRLGVAVWRCGLDGRNIPLDDSRLGSGWHDAEDFGRWTDGDAGLEVAGARVLEIEVAMTERYWVEVEAPIARPAARR